MSSPGFARQQPRKRPWRYRVPKAHRDSWYAPMGSETPSSMLRPARWRNSRSSSSCFINMRPLHVAPQLTEPCPLPFLGQDRRAASGGVEFVDARLLRERFIGPEANRLRRMVLQYSLLQPNMTEHHILPLIASSHRSTCPASTRPPSLSWASSPWVKVRLGAWQILDAQRVAAARRRQLRCDSVGMNHILALVGPPFRPHGARNAPSSIFSTGR